MDTPFVSGGYDLTAENLAAIKAGNAYVSLGQTPFMQGYLPVKMLVDKIKGETDYDLTTGGFIDAGTEIVTADSVTRALRTPGADVRRAGGHRGRSGRFARLLSAAGGRHHRGLGDGHRTRRERVQVAPDDDGRRSPVS